MTAAAKKRAKKVTAQNPVATGFKVLTYDGRPPVQGGDPLCDLRALPVTLPKVKLDRSDAECSRGYNYCASLARAFRIAGLWPDGRPSRAFLVEASQDAIERGNKRRASSLTLVREATDIEIEAAIRESSAPFHLFTDAIVAEQLAWRRALARPERQADAVPDLLAQALAARGLHWKPRRFDDAWDAWAARDARDAWDAWAARDAWAAWDARDAWAAWDARDAWAAWDARDAWAAAWAARDAWAAWDARDALSHFVAVKSSWIAPGDPLAFTTGLRDAYAKGLAIAIPTGPDELGWAMVADVEAKP